MLSFSGQPFFIVLLLVITYRIKLKQNLLDRITLSKAASPREVAAVLSSRTSSHVASQAAYTASLNEV